MDARLGNLVATHLAKPETLQSANVGVGMAWVAAAPPFVELVSLMGNLYRHSIHVLWSLLASVSWLVRLHPNQQIGIIVRLAFDYLVGLVGGPHVVVPAQHHAQVGQRLCSLFYAHRQVYPASQGRNGSCQVSQSNLHSIDRASGELHRFSS